MVIPFNATKTIQAAAIILKQHANRTSRLRLLKLLYIADRESLAQTLRPITGDHAVAMDHGPVLSHTYDLIKQKHVKSPLWDRFIRQEGPQDIALVEDPGNGQLSKGEIDRLISVCDRFRNTDDYAIAKITHEFKEYKKNAPKDANKQNPIPLDDLLEAINLSGHKKEIEENERAEIELDRLIHQASKP